MAHSYLSRKKEKPRVEKTATFDALILLLFPLAASLWMACPASIYSSGLGQHTPIASPLTNGYNTSCSYTYTYITSSYTYAIANSCAIAIS